MRVIPTVPKCLLISMFVALNLLSQKGTCDQSSMVVGEPMQSPFPKTIWTYWSSGESDLPVFVRLCIEKTRKVAKSSNWTVNLLFDDNLHEYINKTRFQQIVEDSQSDKPALKADLIRIMVLAEHGGVWMDATSVLMEDFTWLQKIALEKSVLNKYPQTLAQGGPDLLVFYSPQFRQSVKYHLNDSENAFVDFPVLENWFIAAKPKSEIIEAWRDQFIEFYTMSFEQILETLSQTNLDAMPFMCTSYFRQHAAIIYILHQKQKQISGNHRMRRDGTNMQKSIEYYKVWTMSYLEGIFPVVVMLKLANDYDFVSFEKMYLLDDYREINSPQHPIRFFFKTVHDQWVRFIEIFKKNTIPPQQRQKNSEQTVTINQSNYPQLCQQIDNYQIIVEDSMIHKYLLSQSPILQTLRIVPRDEYNKRISFCQQRNGYIFVNSITILLFKIFIVYLIGRTVFKLWINLGFPLYIFGLRVKQFQEKDADEEELLKERERGGEGNIQKNSRYSLLVRNLRRFEQYQRDRSNLFELGAIGAKLMYLLDIVATTLSANFLYGRAISIFLSVLSAGLAVYLQLQVELFGYKDMYLWTSVVIWICLVLGYISKRCVQIDLQNEEFWYSMAVKWPEKYPNASKSYHYRYEMFYYVLKHLLSSLEVYFLTRSILYLGDKSYSRVPNQAYFIGLVTPLLLKHILHYFAELRLKDQQQSPLHARLLFWLSGKMLFFASFFLLVFEFVPFLQLWTVFSFGHYNYYLIELCNWVAYFACALILILFFKISLWPDREVMLNLNNLENRKSLLKKPIAIFLFVLYYDWIVQGTYLSSCLVYVEIKTVGFVLSFICISLTDLFYVAYNGYPSSRHQRKHSQPQSPRYPYILHSPLGRTPKIPIPLLYFYLYAVVFLTWYCFIHYDTLDHVFEKDDIIFNVTLFVALLFLGVLISLVYMVGLIEIYIFRQFRIMQVFNICVFGLVRGDVGVLTKNFKHSTQQFQGVDAAQIESRRDEIVDHLRNNQASSLVLRP